MTTIGSPVYGGNSNNPLWLSANPTSLSLAGTTPLVLTNDNGVLAQNGVISAPTANWSLYAATSNTIKMDNLGNNITNSGSNLYFNGNLIANASEISNISDWALYAASADVNLSNAGSNNSIVGARNITAISNVSAGSVTSSGAVSGTSSTFTTSVTTPFIFGTSNLQAGCISNLIIYGGSNLTANAPTISNGFIDTYSILGNRGTDYTDFCYTNISNRGGKGGQINLTADAGSVTISGTTYGIGGLINITANSPLTVPYNATSAIKLSAASILSYAGAVTPLGSLAGYNYIQGTLGVNIVAGAASALPNTAGTNYLYGVNGTKIRNYLYTDTIANDTGTDLRIQADTGRSSGGSNNLYLSNVKSIIMEGSNGEVGSLMCIDGSYLSSSNNKGNSFIKNIYGMDNIGYINSTGACAFGSVNATLVKGLTLQGSSLQPYTGYFPGGRCDLTLLAPATPSETVVNNDIVLNASSNIRLITSNSGQVQVTGSISTSNITSSADLTLSATSNLNLNGTVNINGTPLSTLTSNWSTYPATQTVNLSNNTLSNAGVIAAAGNLTLTSLNPSTGFVSLTAGSNYHRMILQTGQPLNISSSNGIQLQGQSLSIYSPIDAVNNTISNIGGLTMSSGANLAMVGGGISTIGAMTFSNGSLTAGGNFPITATGDVRINADSNNGVPGAGFYMTVGSNLTPYHRISAQEGQGMLLGSSNFISIGGTTAYLVSPTIAQSTFSRQMSSSNVAQPVIQYGTGQFAGASGTLVITIPTAYTGSGTYVVQLTMRDSAAIVYALPNTGSTFTITWTGGSGGTQNVMWTTFGT